MAERQNERFPRDDGLDTSPEPPLKYPRTSSPPEVVALLEDKQPEDQDAAHAGVAQRELTADACTAPDLGPRSRMKSWRRSTRGRLSLPALPNASQSLCKSICLNLSDDERLEKLMQAAMQVTVKRLRNTLRTIPGADLEVFQAQADSLETEWASVAQTIREESQLSLSSTSSDPAVQRANQRAKEDLNRLQAESLSWESLLNKHRSKAEELAKRVEDGQERGVKLDPSCLAQSSQSSLIMNKPDYHAVLQRQQKVLNTMELVLESQCMKMRALQSFQEDSAILLKETSVRLARRVGFQDLPSSPVKTLLSGPQSTTSS